jgi:hypothetical protein
MRFGKAARDAWFLRIDPGMGVRIIRQRFEALDDSVDLGPRKAIDRFLPVSRASRAAGARKEAAALQNDDDCHR